MIKRIVLGCTAIVGIVALVELILIFDSVSR